MRYRFNKKYLYLGVTAFIVICASIMFYYFLFHNKNVFTTIRKIISIMMPVIDGFVVAYLLTPVLNFIEQKIVLRLADKIHFKVDTPKRKRKIRSISIVITMIITLYLIYVFLQIVIPQIIKSIENIAYAFPSYMNNFTIWIEKFLEVNPDLERIADQYLNQYTIDVQRWLSSVLPQLNQILKALSSQVLNFFVFFWNLIIGLIISIYMLSSKELFAAQLKKCMYAFFEENRANGIIDEARFIHKTFGDFISGKLVDSFIIGLVCFAVTSIMGTPYAILVSVIVGVTNVIPFFGPYLGAIPSALLILLVNPRQCLYFIIFIIILQQIDGNILGPKILGNSTGLSSFWVIFSITIFGGLFGIIGMFIGVPVFAVLYAAFKRKIARMLHNKDLPDSSTAYLKLRHIHGNKLQLQENPSVSMKDTENCGTEFHIILTKENDGVAAEEKKDE